MSNCARPNASGRWRVLTTMTGWVMSMSAGGLKWQTICCSPSERGTANGKHPQDTAQVASELAAAYLQAQCLEKAVEALASAYGLLAGESRSRVAIDLGNLASHRQQTEQAMRYYTEAEQLSSSAPEIKVAAAKQQENTVPKKIPARGRD